jgi:dTDP-4-dehydrorhamnose reductase
MDVLVGSTGYVGLTLSSKMKFDLAVNSSNAENIRNIECDTLVCAAAPAEKWKANSQPLDDFRNILKIADLLGSVKANRVVLISTVDVYPQPFAQDELDVVNPGIDLNYGCNRLLLEKFVEKTFSSSHIIRLPGLYSVGLKKNLIYDLIHRKDNQYKTIDPRSFFQYFDLELIFEVFTFVIENQIELLNVSVEPIEASSIASLFGKSLSGEKYSHYDIYSKYAEAFGGAKKYLFNAEHSLAGISRLIKQIQV